MSAFYWTALAVVVVLSSARLTRLVTYDKFPPVAWLRNEYIEWTDKTDRRRGWQLLAFCPYCASFWVTLTVVLTALWAGVLDGDAGTPAHIWWIVNGSLGASYLAAVFMVHDGEPADDDEDDS